MKGFRLIYNLGVHASVNCGDYSRQSHKGPDLASIWASFNVAFSGGTRSHTSH